MKAQYILIESVLVLLLINIFNEFRFTPERQRGITITYQKGAGHAPAPAQKSFACLPIRVRRRWIATTYSRKVWLKTTRIVKTGKSGNKVRLSGKASYKLKKTVLNPA